MNVRYFSSLKGVLPPALETILSIKESFIPIQTSELCILLLLRRNEIYRKKEMLPNQNFRVWFRFQIQKPCTQQHLPSDTISKLTICRSRSKNLGIQSMLFSFLKKTESDYISDCIYLSSIKYGLELCHPSRVDTFRVSESRSIRALQVFRQKQRNQEQISAHNCIVCQV